MKRVTYVKFISVIQSFLLFSADAKIKCTFERLEKCFFDNVKEGDQFEWGPGFVS